MILMFCLIFLLCFLITSCEKTEGLLDPTYFFGKFHGITFTDSQANIIKEDPNDWYYEEETENSYPTSIQFKPAYPNPIFVGTETLLTFSIIEASSVFIYIESDNGVVKIIFNGHVPIGNHQINFHSKDDNNNNLPSGVYRCFMETGGNIYYGDVWIKDDF